MSTQKTFLFFIIATLIGSLGWSQSSEYQRPKKGKKASAAAAATATPAAPDDKSDKKDEKKDDKKDVKSDKDAKAAGSSEKVDISDLEQKYWAPKDQEFSVVQNRLYSKAHRFGITPSLGPLVTDSFSSGIVYGLTGNYYFSERYGVEATYNKYALHNSKVTDGFISDNGTVADFNRQTSYYGVAFNWIPIYAKLSLLEKKILYFDMSVSPGIGMMNYYQMRDNNQGANLSSPALSLDVAQHYFLSKEFAFRVDMKNRFYSDKVVKYRTGDFVKEKSNHSITVQFGFTYYFGFGG